MIAVDVAPACEALATTWDAMIGILLEIMVILGCVFAHGGFRVETGSKLDWCVLPVRWDLQEGQRMERCVLCVHIVLLSLLTLLLPSDQPSL